MSELARALPEDTRAPGRIKRAFGAVLEAVVSIPEAELPAEVQAQIRAERVAASARTTERLRAAGWAVSEPVTSMDDVHAFNEQFRLAEETRRRNASDMGIYS